MNRLHVAPCRPHSLLAVAFALALVAPLASARADTGVSGILAFYGRTTGLATVLSAADQVPADLVLGLAAKGIGVHVIVTQESARAGLVKAMGTQPGSDVVMVERLPLSSLPYMDNSVNLVIIDDARALRKQKLDQKELERVVTPGGVIAIAAKGKWQFSRKAWPQGMDNWTHPNYDATGNRVSHDLLVTTPFAYKWIDGLGIPSDRGLGCKGWVVSDGRLFTLSGVEPENMGLAGPKPERPLEFLTARDAFNGLVLWKQPLSLPLERGLWSLIKGSALIKVGAIAVDKKAVYAVRDGKLVAFDVATGAELYTCANEYIPWAVRVTAGTVLTAGFGHGADSANGGIEAFDVATGARRWKIQQSANNIIASGKALFVQVKGDKPEDDYVFGADLATGKELFRLTGKDCGGATPRLLSCGDNWLLVNKRYATMCLSPENGKALWQLDSVPYSWGPVVNGELWVDGGAYDVLTGKKVRTIPKLLLGEGMTANDLGSEFGCVAMGMVENLMLSGRHHRYQTVEKDTLGLYYNRSMRAGCGMSMVAANGMLTAAPVNCICNPVHPLGTVTMAPVVNDPSDAEFTAPQPVEKGPAFGTLNLSTTPSEWPMYRGNAERSAASAPEVPSAYTFTPGWETRVIVPQSNGLLDDSRVSRTLSTLSPPVAGCGKLFVAVTDRGEVIALDQATGAEAWRFRAGSRVETSPTILGDGCFFGCNDGYVYALAAKDGSLAWRTRLAPREQRMMEHGIMESRWPVYGSVLAYNGTIYAAAGRNSEGDGGVVIAALDPATGQRTWSRHIGVTMFGKNDLLSVRDGRIAWQSITLDPVTGAGDLVKARIMLTEEHDMRSGMWDNTYITNPTSRRVGYIYSVDGVKGWMMAWNEGLIVDDKGAVRLRGSDTSRTRGTGQERRRLYFDIATQPTAVVACAKSAILGYSAASAEKGRVVVLTTGGTPAATIPLTSGVVHDGIAVTESGIALSLENGSVAFLRNARLPPRNAGIVVRVNCAGKEYKDSKGVTWAADQEYTQGAWGRVGGGTYDRTPDLPILAEVVDRATGEVKRGMRKNVTGPDPYLYMTELCRPSAYRFTVPNGRYAVVMHFAETYYFNTMLLPNGDLSWVHRRFDVTLNGATVLANFEPAAENKGVTHIPVVKRFETDVADGDITIGFRIIENGPIINAIEVIALPENTAARQGQGTEALAGARSD